MVISAWSSVVHHTFQMNNVIVTVVLARQFETRNEHTTMIGNLSEAGYVTLVKTFIKNISNTCSFCCCWAFDNSVSWVHRLMHMVNINYLYYIWIITDINWNLLSSRKVNLCYKKRKKHRWCFSLSNTAVFFPKKKTEGFVRFQYICWKVWIYSKELLLKHFFYELLCTLNHWLCCQRLLLPVSYFICKCCCCHFHYFLF